MEKILKASIENLPIPILCFSGEGEAKFANSTAKKVFGVENFKGKLIRDIIPFPETKSIKELISENQKLNLLAPIGEVFYDFLITGNSELNLVHVSGFDVTDLKRKERALNLSIAQADEVKQMEKDFLARVSHEVRSPLLVIEGFTELLIGEIDNDLRDEYEPFFYAINNSGKRLIRAFELVLHNYQLHTRIYNSKIEEINLQDIITKIHKDFYSFATEKNIKFTMNSNLIEPPIIEADANSVEQILAILINNAFNFTLKGKIGIKMYDNNDKFIIDVVDTGMGIPDELFGILNRFFSGEHKGSLQGYEVTGLGLETVKMFCELIDAEIDVKTKFGEGSVFTLAFKKLNKMEREIDNEASNIYYLPTTKKPGNY